MSTIMVRNRSCIIWKCNDIYSRFTASYWTWNCSAKEILLMSSKVLLIHLGRWSSEYYWLP